MTENCRKLPRKSGDKKHLGRRWRKLDNNTKLHFQEVDMREMLTKFIRVTMDPCECGDVYSDFIERGKFLKQLRLSAFPEVRFIWRYNENNSVQLFIIHDTMSVTSSIPHLIAYKLDRSKANYKMNMGEEKINKADE
jgi:hypothetical protein